MSEKLEQEISKARLVCAEEDLKLAVARQKLSGARGVLGELETTKAPMPEITKARLEVIDARRDHEIAKVGVTAARYQLRKLEIQASEVAPNRNKGWVQRFDPERGFGFIKSEEAGGYRIFVHISQVRGERPLAEGELVEFDIAQHKGRPVATRVVPLTARATTASLGERP